MTILVIFILTRFIGHHAALSLVLVDVWDCNCSCGSSASLPSRGQRCASGLDEAKRRYTNTDAPGACERNRGEVQRPAGTSERVSRAENLQSGCGGMFMLNAIRIHSESICSFSISK